MQGKLLVFLAYGSRGTRHAMQGKLLVFLAYGSRGTRHAMQGKLLVFLAYGSRGTRDQDVRGMGMLQNVWGINRNPAPSKYQHIQSWHSVTLKQQQLRRERDGEGESIFWPHVAI